MRIVVCDDDKRELSHLRSCIEDYMKNRPEFSYTLLTYHNSNQLMFDLEDRAKADLYILDIDMPEISGLDIAERLKRESPHNLLFFFTSHSEFATEGYRVEARRYILKTDPVERLYEAIDFACDVYERRRKDSVPVVSYHDTINIPINDIMYVIRDGRTLEIHLQNKKTILYRSPIKEFFNKIHRPTFLFIDSSIFINADYVYRTKDNIVTMFDKK